MALARFPFVHAARRWRTCAPIRAGARWASSVQMPAVDISPFLSGGTALQRQQCAETLDRACRETGFFYLEGHGVDEAEVQSLHRLSKNFFSLPSATKETIALSAQRDFGRGYQKLGMNVTKEKKDWQEAIDFFAEPSPGAVSYSALARSPSMNEAELEQVQKFVEGRNLWPQSPDHFASAAKDYFAKMNKVGDALMKAMAVAFGLPEAHFHPLMSDSFWGARIIGYPALPADAPGLSCGEHTDYGCWVIVAQDETPGALEAKMPSGRWVPITPAPGKLVVNLGDMLSVWTQGRWMATEHRVRHTASNFRTSLVYFHEPNFDAVIRPLDLPDPPPVRECVASSAALERGLAGGSIIYGEHLFARVSQNFDFSE